VVAQADHRLTRLVLGRDGPQLAGHGVLAPGRGQVELGGGADGARHRRVHQRLERVEAERGEHDLDVLGRQPDVPVDERQGGLELGERGVV